jgi:hypothetical protein
MTASEILKNWLIENQYDGLCNRDCGCDVDDIAPCGQIGTDCQPAYRVAYPFEGGVWIYQASPEIDEKRTF